MPKEKCIKGVNIHHLMIGISKVLKVPSKMEIAVKHPRDFFGFGRCRFRLHDMSGNFANEKIMTKKDLFKALCDNWENVLKEYNEILDKQKTVVEERKKQMEEK